MEPATCSFNESVNGNIKDLSDGLKKKIEAYRDILILEGHNLRHPYSDKIEGYTNLFELRPSFNNIEYRLLYFWQGNHAQVVNSFVEKGKKKERKRKTDGNIKKQK